MSNFFTDEHERIHLERKLTRDMLDRFDYLQQQIDVLNQTALDQPVYYAPPNYLPNSHPEWSKLAYGTGGTTPSTAGDTNRECYNWYRFTAATTSLSESAANALKRDHATPHSLWAANEGTNDNIPIWDGVNGTIKLGGDTTLWDVACPLNVEIVSPGQTYFVTMEFQTSGAKSTTQQVYCGFWDNVNGQWVQGTAFTPAVSVYGAPGSRTLAYKVHAFTDSGEEILSTEVSASTAPSTLSAENHVRLSFSGAPGFTRFDIYRKDGSNYYRVGSIRNSIDLQFYDAQETGSTVVPVSGYPSVTADAPAAYAISDVFDPNDQSSFTVHLFRIRVPTTYDRSTVTAGNQWFRFGLTELTNSREIIVRRIGVSEGYGGWTRAPEDQTAASPPTSTATSGPEPGYPIPVPPDRGTGGPSCVTLDTEIETLNHLFEIIKRPISQIQKGMYLNCGATALPVKGVKEGKVSSVLHITTDGGYSLKCSHSHKLIRSQMDKVGIAAGSIKKGDKVLVHRDGKFERDVVESVVEIVGETTVKSVRLPSPHLFLTNGFVSHNLKSELPEV